mmetsp:Transcript_13374/g.31767  ORF Transcript_13374/g.31767 Transcript_13374/m.31767 type:complete len:85 (-) Transcript_13374:93-347(-)
MELLRFFFLLVSLAISVSALREEMEDPFPCCAMKSDGEDTRMACVSHTRAACSVYDRDDKRLTFQTVDFARCASGARSCKEISK